jgi:leucine dehydrogenase
MLQIKDGAPMSVFSAVDYDNHEQVVFFSDQDTGLKAIVAIHSTVLGPAVGGCRMWNYASEQDAIDDVLRLSKGMSLKNAMADLGLGGGKSVIIGDPHTEKTPELFRAFGRMLDRLGGHYITAEDVGIDVADMQIVATQTKYVAGLETGDHPSGDPSPYTAHGVFYGIRAAVEHRLGKKDLSGLTVLVQGLGHVGYNLCRELNEAGANLVVTDIDRDNVDRVTSEFGAKAVEPDAIFEQQGDVFAPCALGAILNDHTILKLKVPVVAGAANNQLKRNHNGEELRRLGILYAPDYVINAGGIIQVANEVYGRDTNVGEGMRKVEEVYGTLMEVFNEADKEGKPTNQIADTIAGRRIEAARKK